MLNQPLVEANPVRRARLERGLTQVQLAVRSGVSLGTVRLAEYGLGTTRTLGRIARALGVDVDVLRGRKAAP